MPISYLFGWQRIQDRIQGRVDGEGEYSNPDSEVSSWFVRLFNDGSHANHYHRHPAHTITKNDEKHPPCKSCFPPKVWSSCLDLSLSTLTSQSPAWQVRLDEYHEISTHDEQEKSKIQSEKDSDRVFPTCWLTRSKLQGQTYHTSTIITMVPEWVFKIPNAKHRQESNKKAYCPYDDAKDTCCLWFQRWTLIRKHNIFEAVSGYKCHHHYRHLTWQEGDRSHYLTRQTRPPLEVMQVIFSSPQQIFGAKSD